MTPPELWLSGSFQKSPKDAEAATFARERALDVDLKFQWVKTVENNQRRGLAATTTTTTRDAKSR